MIAFRAGDGRRFQPVAFQSYLHRCGRDLSDDALVNRRIAHDTARSHVVAAALELRLHEGDDTTLRRQERRDDGQDLRERNERHVDDDEGERADPARQTNCPRSGYT